MGTSDQKMNCMIGFLNLEPMHFRIMYLILLNPCLSVFIRG